MAREYCTLEELLDMQSKDLKHGLENDYRKFYTPEELCEMQRKDLDSGLQRDYRKFYTPEDFYEMGGWQYPQEYKDIVKKITDGIVSENTTPTAESLEIARHIYRSEIKNRQGGELFNLYVKARFYQLTTPNTSPKLKAKLYEELVTIVNIVDQTVSKDTSLTEGWGAKADISIGTNMAMSVAEIMKNLYLNREMYGLPEYIHLPVAGNTQAPWGVLDPNRTVESCQVMHVLSSLVNSSFGTQGVAFPEEINQKLSQSPEELHKKFMEQGKKLQAEQDKFNRMQEEMGRDSL